MSQDDNSEEKARDAARNLRDSLDTSNITGELEASFYEHIDGIIRQGDVPACISSIAPKTRNMTACGNKRACLLDN
jgi:hypothetical protein